MVIKGVISLLGFMFYVFHFIIEKTNFRALTSLTQYHKTKGTIR